MKVQLIGKHYKALIQTDADGVPVVTIVSLLSGASLPLSSTDALELFALFYRLYGDLLKLED